MRSKFEQIDKDFKQHVHHTNDEILAFTENIPNIDGVIVEAGVFQGIGSAKISLVADQMNKNLYCFDSFEGLPENNEPHDKNIWGQKMRFRKGYFAASLEEVEENIKKYGKIERCKFVKGWFEDTLPYFKEPIAAIYIDVDLASSTETCLKYLWPLLNSGGLICSQDGHVPLVVDVFRKFAEKENLTIDGLGKKKLIKLWKA